MKLFKFDVHERRRIKSYNIEKIKAAGLWSLSGFSFEIDKKILLGRTGVIVDRTFITTNGRTNVYLIDFGHVDHPSYAGRYRGWVTEDSLIPEGGRRDFTAKNAKNKPEGL